MRSLRVVNGMFLAAMVAGAIVTYGLKHQAEVAAEDVIHLQTAIAGEKDKIRTLNAEWSLLTQPSRLEAAVKQHADYFQLQPFSPDQIATINEIPMRLPVVDTTPTAAIAGTTTSDAVKATL